MTPLPSPLMARTLEISIPGHGRVGALLDRPDRPRALLALAHGAGAGMRHTFMAAVSRGLLAHGVATLRYQFPYMEAGRKRPDSPAVAVATVRAATRYARDAADGLPFFAGGKSFGGRMTSQAAAEEPLPGARGLVFLGFPLHAAGRPGTARADHLRGVPLPMLFVQGTRDPLAEPALIEDVAAGMADKATLHVIQGGDHSFRVLKRSGRTDEEALGEVVDVVAGWILDRSG